MPTDRQLVNESKRAELQRSIKTALRLGWTQATLAALFRLSTTAIRSYERGGSMSNNDFRRKLHELKSPGDERLLITSTIKLCNDLIETKSRDLVENGHKSAPRYVAFQKSDIALEKKRVELLNTLL